MNTFEGWKSMKIVVTRMSVLGMPASVIPVSLEPDSRIRLPLQQRLLRVSSSELFAPSSALELPIPRFGFQLSWGRVWEWRWRGCEELNRQDQLVDEADTKTEQASTAMKTTNSRLKESVTAMRSSRNFCIDITLLVIILGIAAYLYKFIPSKEKYLAIQAQNCEEHPFVCALAQEWGVNLKCVAPTNVEDHVTENQMSPTTRQDSVPCLPASHELVDEQKEEQLQSEGFCYKHSIACPPEGFNRRVVVRVKKASKFADVYYDTLCGKTLRSMVEVRKFLDDHPELGADITQFSFEIPSPKRPKKWKKSIKRSKKYQAQEDQKVDEKKKILL